MPSKWHNPTFASIVVFLAAGFWGLYWIPLRFLGEIGLAVTWPILFINLPGALALGLWLLTHWEAHRPHMRRALLCGFFTGMGFGMFAIGVLYGSVIRVTLLFYLTPVWGTLIGMLWLGDKAGWTRWLAIATGLLGMGVMLSGETGMPLNIGDLFGLLSGLSWAIGGALIMRFGAVPVAASTFAQLATATLLALTALIISSAPLPASTTLLPGSLIGLATAFLMIIPTMMVVFWAQKILFPGRLGLLMMAEALLAILSASLLLPEEAMSATEWLGAALIMSACLLEILLSPNGAKAH